MKVKKFINCTVINDVATNFYRELYKEGDEKLTREKRGGKKIEEKIPKILPEDVEDAMKKLKANKALGAND